MMRLEEKSGDIDPDMGEWSYTYDANGNLETQTDNKTQTTTFTYDELNRVLTKTYSTSDPTVEYVYDNTTSGSNGKGQLHYVERKSGSTILVRKTYDEYDSMGRVEKETKYIQGDSNRETQYQYDLSVKVVKTIFPDSSEVDNIYWPGANLLHQVTNSGSINYATLSEYEPSGKIGLIDYHNGASTSYTYDPKSMRLMSTTTEDGSGLPNNDIQRKFYQYSPAGDIIGINDELHSAIYLYGYDELHRLTWEKTNGVQSASYSYNSIGNLLTKTIGSDSYIQTYTLPQKHAVYSVSKNGTTRNFSYDLNGNMVSGYDFSGSSPILRTIAYNTDNMPDTITKSGVTTEFIYDGDGNRAKKIVSGQPNPTYYINDQTEIIDGDFVSYIFAGNLRIAKKQGTDVYYFHKDHLGSSIAITNASGNELETTEYLPYGSNRTHWAQSGDISDYKFTDQELDTSTNLYNYDARLYDPVTGRFISPDSMIPDVYNPQSLNRYSYCLNNPLIYDDPSGHFVGVLGWVFVASVILLGMTLTAQNQLQNQNGIPKINLGGDSWNPEDIGDPPWKAAGEDGNDGGDENGKQAGDDEGSADTNTGTDPGDDPNNDPDDNNGSRESTPDTEKEKFENIKKSKAKINKKTKEVWEKDRLHKNHYEVYKNKKQWEKGIRDRAVWEDGRLKQKF